MLHIPQAQSAQVARLDDAAATLPDLAVTIRAEHAAVGQAVDDALSHALGAGRALIAARRLVPEKGWGAWLKKNRDISDRHARRYAALVHAYDASGHTVPGDLVGLSLRGLMRKLTPPQASRRPSPATRPAAQPRGGLDVVDALGWWSRASIADRRRFIDNVGWTELVGAIPQGWYPTVQQWLGARTTATAPAAPVDYGGDLTIPDDLSVPVFLRRTEMKPKPKPRSKAKAAVS